MCVCVCSGMWEGLPVWRWYVLCSQPVDPEPANVHPNGSGGRRLPSNEPQGSFPHFPSHLYHYDFFPCLSMFLICHFYLGAILWQETPSYMPLSAQLSLHHHSWRQVQMSPAISIPGSVPLMKMLAWVPCKCLYKVYRCKSVFLIDSRFILLNLFNLYGK